MALAFALGPKLLTALLLAAYQSVVRGVTLHNEPLLLSLNDSSVFIFLELYFGVLAAKTRILQKQVELSPKVLCSEVSRTEIASASIPVDVYSL